MWVLYVCVYSVCAHVYGHTCTGEHEHVCICMYRPEVDFSQVSVWSAVHFIDGGSISWETQSALILATLGIALGNSLSLFLDCRGYRQLPCLLSFDTGSGDLSHQTFSSGHIITMHFL